MGIAQLFPSTEQRARIFSGNELIEGMTPYSTRYGGHQFGHWAGQLGDGRAITLGEFTNDQNQKWEIQLKGAGLTPYSRNGDGRAVLRSSLREYICSEAMNALGIPSTRALCCVLTGEKVLRDMFYDGRPEWETGAITTRVAPTFLRFGNFEILTAQKEIDNLKKLADFTITQFFPEIAQQKNSSQEQYLNWFHEVCKRTAQLMAHWTRVGFVHGVMNTDNMSILGLTIDYGPYGWLDDYDPQWTPNTSDGEQRRYRYAHQPSIAYWNLEKLAQAISPLIENPKTLESGLDLYRQEFSNLARHFFAQKLGFESYEADLESLIANLDAALQEEETDFTIFYRLLGNTLAFKNADAALHSLTDSFYSPNRPHELLKEWLKQYFQHIEQKNLLARDMKKTMDRVNPVVTPRNFITQQIFEEIEKGNITPLTQFMNAIKTPYEMNENTALYFTKRPEWARSKPGCSMLSCSS